MAALHLSRRLEAERVIRRHRHLIAPSEGRPHRHPTGLR
jgi:hypothetical protein